MTTVLVAFVMCLVAGAAVSGISIVLQPMQAENRENDRKKVILQIAGLFEEGKAIDELFAQVEPKVVDLETGEYVEAAGFDQRKAAADPAESIAIPPKRDFAKIRRRAKRASVYLVRENGEVKHLILPVHGYGLWSTMYGYVALEVDGNTIYGVQFYEQAETAGLGDRVVDPAWVGQFQGKKVYDEQGRVRVRVVKGHVAPNSPTAGYEVDGMSGATLTSDGVTNMMLYWFGDQGFEAYLKKLRS